MRVVTAPGLVILDDDGEEVALDPDESAYLLAVTEDLDAATVSACPTCRSRILAAVALVDVLADAPPFGRSGDLVRLADDAPTLHLYVRDAAADCRHGAWRDPGFEEWADVMADVDEPPRAR